MRNANDQPKVSNPSGQANGHCGTFTTTHWSVVLRASQDDPAGAAALEQLCQVYWLPIYSFIRRKCATGPEETQDLTQGFFYELLRRQAIRRVKPDQGKFRAFLLKVLTDFLANEWDKNHAWKRGGRIEIISLDEAQAAGHYDVEPVEPATPEQLFDRDWAAALLNQVLSRLEKEYAEEGKAALFAKLAPAMAQVEDGFYDQCAADLEMSAGNAKVAMHRLRRRYRELLRAEVAQTVANPGEIEDEIRQLFAATGG